METLTVTIEYGSEEPFNGFYHLYTFRKTFGFKKLPCIPSYIFLDEVQREVYFKDPTFYPSTGVYHLKNRSSHALKRYYGGSDIRDGIANARAELYKMHGWEVEKIKTNTS